MTHQVLDQVQSVGRRINHHAQPEALVVEGRAGGLETVHVDHRRGDRQAEPLVGEQLVQVAGGIGVVAERAGHHDPMASATEAEAVRAALGHERERLQVRRGAPIGFAGDHVAESAPAGGRPAELRLEVVVRQLGLGPVVDVEGAHDPALVVDPAEQLRGVDGEPGAVDDASAAELGERHALERDVPIEVCDVARRHVRRATVHPEERVAVGAAGRPQDVVAVHQREVEAVGEVLVGVGRDNRGRRTGDNHVRAFVESDESEERRVREDSDFCRESCPDRKLRGAGVVGPPEIDPAVGAGRRGCPHPRIHFRDQRRRRGIPARKEEHGVFLRSPREVEPVVALVVDARDDLEAVEHARVTARLSLDRSRHRFGCRPWRGVGAGWQVYNRRTAVVDRERLAGRYDR